MITKRGIATAIVFSLLTCGIYSIYWFIKLTDEVNFITNNKNDTSGGTAFLLTLLTCGIYGIYWAYKMGEKLDYFEGKSASRGVVYLLLQLFGFGIITYALIQDTINKTA